ncbi:FeoB-associated Cys-rich membrane protein [Geoalkalibacter sp.]|nr:FeoB-associated Cys-rich membrane protein [Geoalkalibacter sp.]
MGLVDLLWMGLVLGGTGWLLYRSLRKKKGPCGCTDCGCRKG